MPQRVPRDVAAHYERVQTYQADALTETLRAWREVSPDRISESWERVLPHAAAAVTSAQVSAAESALISNGDMAVDTGQYELPAAFVDPESVAGMSSTGGDIEAALYTPAIKAKQAIAGGMLAPAAVRETRKEFDRLVRSLVSDAGRQAATADMATRFTGGYVRMLNPPSCKRCVPLAGRWYRWNDGFLRHPRCFPAGVVVSGPRSEAAARRWYDGELVVFTTASGKELPITGNHPVLTARGWVPANLLQEGDEVVRSTRPEGATALVIPDHHEMPSLIEDVWRALSVGGLHRVPTTAEDFHGDGQDGEVDVVYADRALSDGLNPSLAEQVTERLLSYGIMVPQPFILERMTELRDLWGGAESGGAIGSRGLRLPFGSAQAGIPLNARFAHASALNACGSEDASDRATGDSVLLGERVLARPSLVGGNDLSFGEVATAPRWDAPGDSFSVKTRDGYASRGRDLLERLSGQVELDRVVEVRRVQWSGHVYSLTSSEGWHNANGLIVSNCDCVHIPAKSRQWAQDEGFIADPYEYFEGLDKAAQDRLLGPGAAQAVRDGGDIYQVINATTARRAGASPVSADGMTTTASTSRRRGITRGRERLTPDGIYARAGGDRAKALRMLEEHGYILPGGQDPEGVLHGSREGWGALGRGGTRVGSRAEIERARRTGIRHPSSRYTMTEAERRRFDAALSWDAVREGRNPYGRGPLTDEDRRRAEFAYQRYVLGMYGGDPALPRR